MAQDDLGARLLDGLPFGLTGAQLRAMAEIVEVYGFLGWYCLFGLRGGVK